MKKYDVRIEMVDNYEEKLMMVIEDVEAENERIAKVIALSYAKSLIQFNVVSIKELTWKNMM